MVMRMRNWQEEQLKTLVQEAQSLSRTHFPQELLVSAPSQKQYDVSHYQNQRQVFQLLSVTGSHCALNCDHCGTKVLEGMQVVSSRARFQSAVADLPQKGAEGVLISGGCLDDGSVPLDRFLDQIAQLKDEGLTVLVHTGLVRPEIARGLKQAGVDQVLLDIIGDDDTIHDVYHLDKTTQDYRRALAVLQEYGLYAVPHIVVGLHYGALRGEFEAIEMVQEEGANQLVIVVLTALPGTPMAKIPTVAADDVGRVLAAARITMPTIPLSLGCAKPPGPGKQLMEHYAVDVGVQSIAYPLTDTIDYATEQGYHIRFHEKCCSLLTAG